MRGLYAPLPQLIANYSHIGMFHDTLIQLYSIQPLSQFNRLASPALCWVHAPYKKKHNSNIVVTYMTINNNKMIVARMNGMRAMPPPGFSKSWMNDIAAVSSIELVSGVNWMDCELSCHSATTGNFPLNLHISENCNFSNLVNQIQTLIEICCAINCQYQQAASQGELLHPHL